MFKDKFRPRSFKLNLDSEKINYGIMKNYPKMLCLNSVIVKWTLNFEDEISFKGGRV